MLPKVLLSLATFFMAASIVPAAYTISQNQKERVTVDITANGFEPNEVSIKTGTTITFSNKDNQAHWPASNIHPTHAIFPEFDPKQPIEAGQSWSFTPQKAGEFAYHDHLFAQYTGKLTVTGTNMPKSLVKNSLEQLKERLTDLNYQLLPAKTKEKAQELNIFELVEDEQKTKYWLRTVGFEPLMQRLIAQSQQISLDCHQEAHILGKLAYSVSGQEAFEKGDAACHSGFYHGAMEAFIYKEGTENLATKIASLCQLFKTSFGNFECLHGVGHGLLAYSNYNLPEGIELCRTLKDSFAQESCYGGMFMENIVVPQGQGAAPVHKTDWLSVDPHFPCNALKYDQPVMLQCYYMQTSRMLFLFSSDWQKVAAECLNAQKDMIMPCYRSLGRDAAGAVLRDPQKIIDTCDLTPNKYEYRRECIQGAANVIIDFWGPGLKNQARDLCIALAGELKNDCYSLLAARLRGLFTEQKNIDEICTGFEKEYQDLCAS